MTIETLLTNAHFAAIVTGLGTSVLGGLIGYMTAKAQKAPDVQASLNAAVAGVIGHYTTALESARKETAELRLEIADLRQTIQDQSSVIEDLEDHIDTLTTAMTQAGVTAPPRKKRLARA